MIKTIVKRSEIKNQNNTYSTIANFFKSQDNLNSIN